MLTDIVQTRLRTEQEIEQDLAYVAQLYVRGIPLREISLAIERRYGGEIRAGVHLIEDDVVRIRKEWINSALLEFDELRAAELAHLDALEAAYWKAWETSENPKTITEKVKGTEQIISSGKIHDLLTESNKETIEERDGNALYLQGVERCIEKRCKILGLFSPETYRIDWRKDVEKLGWKPEDVEMLKEGAVKFIMATLEKAADNGKISSGNIIDAEFDDDNQQEL